MSSRVWLSLLWMGCADVADPPHPKASLALPDAEAGACTLECSNRLSCDSEAQTDPAFWQRACYSHCPANQQCVQPAGGCSGTCSTDTLGATCGGTCVPE
jgi:hypothetical protein